MVSRLEVLALLVCAGCSSRAIDLGGPTAPPTYDLSMAPHPDLSTAPPAHDLSIAPPSPDLAAPLSPPSSCTLDLECGAPVCTSQYTIERPKCDAGGCRKSVLYCPSGCNSVMLECNDPGGGGWGGGS
jgi:hypothetical protein